LINLTTFAFLYSFEGVVNLLISSTFAVSFSIVFLSASSFSLICFSNSASFSNSFSSSSSSVSSEDFEPI